MAERAQKRLTLSRERVLEAAIALAQREGLASLTMRRLADELGVGVMTLYHYVPNKDALLDGMVEVVFGELEPPRPDMEWKTALRSRALATRAALNRHLWAVGLMESRRIPGPNSMRLHDAVLGVLREAGFSVELTVQAYAVQDAYIYGFALQESTIPFDDAAGAAAVAEAQAAAYEAGAFPYLAEVVAGHIATVGYDFASSFEFGLDLILDALERRRDLSEPS